MNFDDDYGRNNNESFANELCNSEQTISLKAHWYLMLIMILEVYGLGLLYYYKEEELRKRYKLEYKICSTLPCLWRKYSVSC